MGGEPERAGEGDEDELGLAAAGEAAGEDDSGAGELGRRRRCPNGRPRCGDMVLDEECAVCLGRGVKLREQAARRPACPVAQ